MDNKKILKGRNTTYRGRKIVNINKKKWQIKKKEQWHLIRGKDRTNSKIRNKLDSDICT